MGHPDDVPKISWIPRICEIKIPKVTPNWLTVPKPPRRWRGAISDMYNGTSDVFKPLILPVKIVLENKNL